MPIPQAAHYMNCPLHELPITGVLLYLISGEGPYYGLLFVEIKCRRISLQLYYLYIYVAGVC